MENINVNLENLNQSERDQLMELIQKSNTSKPKNKNWKPDSGDYYYCIGADGEIMQNLFERDSYDFGTLVMGNCYPTERDAIFAREKLKALAELQRYANKYNEEMNWEDFESEKYFIAFNCRTRDIYVSSSVGQQIGCIYFSSRGIAQKAIDSVGKNRIKTYLFIL